MAESRETYAYFWVAGEALPHSTISEMLGLEPTRHWNKGDPGRYVQQQKQARWEYHSPLSRDEVFIDSHISALVEVLETSASAVATLQGQYDIGIQCVGYYTEANPGFHLSKELIGRICALGVEVDFDLYCVHEGQDGRAI